MRLVSSRILIMFLLIGVLPVVAQQRRDLLRDVPAALYPHSAALGDRVVVPGKERTVFAGQFVDRNGKSAAVRLTLQLGGLLRLEGLIPDGSLLEAFTSDTAEGMLAAVKDGAAVQLIARRVDTDPSKRQKKPLFDIFEVSGPVRTNETSVDRLKRYFFDSETGLLASTQYLDETFSPPMGVETRFSNWRHFDGSAYPGHIERLENGHTVFSLTVDTIAASPRQEPASFR